MAKPTVSALKWPGRRRNLLLCEKNSLETKALLKAEELEKLLILMEKLENSLKSQKVQRKFPRWLSRRGRLLKRAGSRLPWATLNSRWAERPSTVVLGGRVSPQGRIWHERVPLWSGNTFSGSNSSTERHERGGKLCWASGHTSHVIPSSTR